MGQYWRQIPALLAGAGVLVLVLYVMGLPTSGRPEPAQKQPLESAIAAKPVPLPSPVATRPSEALARTVELAARGALPTPYFVDQAEAARFLDRWKGDLVEGKALVAMADQFDAGAEEGHRVPVTLWLDSGRQVMGLTGEATFEPTQGGRRLRELSLRKLTLAISSWAEAEKRLHQAGATAPARIRAPFYGRFRFVVGGKHYSVDAVSGEVIVE